MTTSSLVRFNPPIPVAPRQIGKHSEFKAELLGLRIGESTYYSAISAISAPSFCTKVGAYNCKKFIARPEGDGVRYWRSE